MKTKSTVNQLLKHSGKVTKKFEKDMGIKKKRVRKPKVTKIIVKNGKIKAPKTDGKITINVSNRNTPLYIYTRAVKHHNKSIKQLKRDIRAHRLLKIQAYIAYRLTR